MDVIRTAPDLTDRLQDASPVLVPTMGALHEGHLSLTAIARECLSTKTACVVASIFVNPDQFNDSKDLDRYPRPLDEDLAALQRAGVDVAFVPTVEMMYPEDDALAAPQPAVPPVGRLPGLEDRWRPGHFAGVCRVVSRLFDLVRPVHAIFGAKDWQQARVVEALCHEQRREVSVLIGDTVREPDGLAMSSRNEHLSPKAREAAAGIFRGFEAARRSPSIASAEKAISECMLEAGFIVEYATIRDGKTLLDPTVASEQPLRMLAAGRLDGIRLLDNAPWYA